jgi:SHS2 domain-containing protein
MHEWRSHTAEVELAIEAETPEQVFHESALAFGELIARGGEGKPASHAVVLAAPDRGALLVDWLEELIFLADTEQFIPEGADELDADEHSLRGTVVGRRGDVEPLVKAATYHGLRFTQEGGMWQARVVLDV